MWDIVHITYTAVFEKKPHIIYQTTQYDRALDMKAFLSTLISSWSYACKIGKDKNLPKSLQDALVGMKAWDTKRVIITSKELTGTAYDPSKIIRENMQGYKNMWISFTKGDVIIKNWSYVVVKDILWDGPVQEVIFDANPLETYSDVVYDIKVLQVGGKKLSSQ